MEFHATVSGVAEWFERMSNLIIMYSYSWFAHVRTPPTLSCLLKIAVCDAHLLPRSKIGTCEGSFGTVELVISNPAGHVCGSNSGCYVARLKV